MGIQLSRLSRRGTGNKTLHLEFSISSGGAGSRTTSGPNNDEALQRFSKPTSRLVPSRTSLSLTFWQRIGSGFRLRIYPAPSQKRDHRREYAPGNSPGTAVCYLADRNRDATPGADLGSNLAAVFAPEMRTRRSGHFPALRLKTRMGMCARTAHAFWLANLWRIRCIKRYPELPLKVLWWSLWFSFDVFAAVLSYRVDP